ncbi:MAG: PilZ domain-containing protein [Spirochaetota bacterium]
MEKRRNTRVAFEVGAVVKYKRKAIKGKVVNLSLNGILLKTEQEIPKDSKVKVSISMEGTTSRLTVNIDGTVVRDNKSETAVAFNAIDLDSFIHLKNIIIYNEGNEEKVMQEFFKRA